MKPPNLAALLLLLLISAAQAQVRRAEAMAIAETYLTLQWTPAAQNAFHGRDAEGVLVDTPDAGFTRPGIRPGWWQPNQVNQGMPYMWGGFCTAAEFTTGLQRGAYAGDVCTGEKRRLGDAAVSKHVVGIDCSGLVSRCWKLDRAYSTRELPALCSPLASYDDLKPGDILNTPDKHVLLFRAFTTGQKDRLLAYEAGSPPTWKVLLDSIPVTMLKEQGYQAWRYRKMRE